MKEIEDIVNTLESLKMQIDYLEKQINRSILKETHRQIPQEYIQKTIQTASILEDLQKERYGGKHLYSYADIAEQYGVSLSKVARLAAKHHVSRHKEGF